MATSYYCENIAPDIAAISMSGKMMMVPPTTASVVFTPSIFSSSIFSMSLISTLTGMVVAC